MDYFGYKILFQNFQISNSALLPGFSMSDDERVLARQRSESLYPQLQLDRPTVTPEIQHGGRHKDTIQGSVAILAPAAKDDWTKQENRLQELLPIMQALIAWLDYNRKISSFKLIRVGEIYPIERYEHGNLWGWAVSLTFETPANYCYDTGELFQISHYYAQWYDNVNELLLTINGQDYTVPWLAEDRLGQALEQLRDLINDAGDNVFAIVDDDHIILRASDPGEIFTVDNVSTNLTLITY